MQCASGNSLYAFSQADAMAASERAPLVIAGVSRAFLCDSDRNAETGTPNLSPTAPRFALIKNRCGCFDHLAKKGILAVGRMFFLSVNG
jgi:hypothetical protein